MHVDKSALFDCSYNTIQYNTIQTVYVSLSGTALPVSVCLCLCLCLPVLETVVCILYSTLLYSTLLYSTLFYSTLLYTDPSSLLLDLCPSFPSSLPFPPLPFPLTPHLNLLYFTLLYFTLPYHTIPELAQGPGPRYTYTRASQPASHPAPMACMHHVIAPGRGGPFAQHEVCPWV